MIRWSLVLVLSIVGIAMWGLPPGRFGVDREWAVDRGPERQAFVDLHRELQREGWRYQRIQWRDSLTQSLMRSRARGRPYVVGFPGEAPDSVQERLDAGMRLHLARLGVQDPVVPVGAFLVDQTQSAHPAGPKNPSRPWWSREYYVGRDGEPPFCFVVQRVNGSYPRELGRSARELAHIPPDSVSTPNTLRLCGFYARFGAPGNGIRTWLASGAHHFGVGVSRDRLPPFIGPVRGPLGVAFGGRYYSRQVSPRAMACLGGAESACAAAFLDPGVGLQEAFLDNLPMAFDQRSSPLDFLEIRWAEKDFGEWEEFLFEDLVEEFGTARFQAFWFYEGDPEAGFQAAFGQPVGDWMMRWAQDRFGTIDRGPGVPVSATLFSLLALGILSGGAVYAGRR